MSPRFTCRNRLAQNVRYGQAAIRRKHQLRKRCADWGKIKADRWPDHIRLSDLELRSTCQVHKCQTPWRSPASPVVCPALDGLFVAGEHLPRAFAAELGNRQSQKKPHQSAAVIVLDRFVFCRGPSGTHGIRFYTGEMGIFGGGDSRLVRACMSHCQLSEILVHN
jgi:hypothetical protein